MKYKVVLKSPGEALVKTDYLTSTFTYIFLHVHFEPTPHAKKKEVPVPKEYTFTSSALQPPYALDDPKRYKIIRQKFHGEDDIRQVIEATTLQEACDKFSAPFGDVFEVVGK
jgi:hypothetical protein